MGWLDVETRAELNVSGDVRSGIIVVPSPIPTAEYFGLEIILPPVRSPQVIAGRPSIKLEVHCNAGLGEYKDLSISVEPSLAGN